MWVHPHIKNDLTPEVSSAELRSAGLQPGERWWEGGTTLEVRADGLLSARECSCVYAGVDAEESAFLLLLGRAA